MKLRSLPLLLLWATPALADDAIYRWTDKEGVVHYTDDPQSIPKGTKAETTQGDEVGELLAKQPAAPEPPPEKDPRSHRSRKHKRADTVEPKRPAEEEDEARRRAQEEDEQQRAQEEEDKRVEAQWRAAFGNAREKVRQAEEALAEERKHLGNDGLTVLAQVNSRVGPNGIPQVEVTDRHQLEARVKQREEALEEAQRELDALEREASSYGIPREWRQ